MFHTTKVTTVRNSYCMNYLNKTSKKSRINWLSAIAVFLLLVISSPSQAQKHKSVKKQQKEQADKQKEQKAELEKKYEADIKKQMKLQTKETLKRMKKDKRKSKRLMNHKHSESFLKRLFTKKPH